MRKFLIVPVALAGLVALSACSSGTDTGKAASPTNGAPSAAISATPSPSSSNIDGVYKFGQTVSFKDGIELTVAAPQAFQPSEYTTVKGTALGVQITLTNGSKKPVAPLETIMTAASAGEQDADSIIDSANGYELAPSAKVLPGKSVTWKEGFDAATPTGLQVDVTMLDHTLSLNEATFTE